jgi:hypothetical protein
MKYLPLLFLVALMGCEERYRYPCQDPANWNEEFCKKPICSANGTCPEDLTPYEKDKVGAAPGNSNVQPAPSRGDCK